MTRRVTRRRAAIASAGALAASALAASLPSSASSVFTFHARYVYGGSEAARTLTFERPTSFSPVAESETITWDYQWTFSCAVTTAPTADPQGEVVGCNATAGNVSGTYADHYLFPLGTDCDATYSTAPGASLALRATVLDDAATRVQFLAYPPQNGPVLLATPTCGYPPGNIVFAGSTSVRKVARIDPIDSGVISNHASGVLTGFAGEVRFSSDFLYQLSPRAFESSGVPSDYLRVMGDQIAQWISDQVDAYRPGAATTTFDDEHQVFLDSVAAGRVWVRASAGDPVPLLDVHQALAANTPTALAATIAPSTLRELARAPGPVTLTVAIAFTPERGRATSYSATQPLSLWPDISSVTFAGSPAAPVVTVHGSSLGPVPGPSPATLSGSDGCPAESGATGADYGAGLALTDLSGGWGAGRDLEGVEVDCIGLRASASSASSLTLRPGSSYAATTKYRLREGDKVQLTVGGAVITVHVAYGRTVSS